MLKPFVLRRFSAAAVAAAAVALAGLAQGQVPTGRAPSEPTDDGKGAPVKPAKSESPEFTNRLIEETSPYLLQHAHNPVDWYPWGPEAFEKARKEDKPIFLSVGYSSCHWCHVMERESFESEEIAAILNEHFVSIKVDREERPDVDEIYMTAVQAMTGSGGWPMSVFLTPDLDPFYGGTYFPPEDRYGRPGFKSVLNHLAKVWKEKRGEIEKGADRLSEHMQDILGGAQGQPGDVNAKLIHDAAAELLRAFDPAEGGFGQAPKFPSAPSIALLLREYNRVRDSALLHAATLTLDRMAAGGIYDHLGGGFSRYSTDDRWLVPHFEKMLYDNAQLAQAYLEAYQLTGNDPYHRIVEETLRYVLRDMTDERGGFYSAEDADSEGQEGKFYVWTYDEVVAVLGSEGADRFAAYYNVKPEGNFQSHESYHAGQNILHTPRPFEEVAEELGADPEKYCQELAEMKQKLLEVRNQRVRPGLDDKVLASWNALMISAFARAAQVLHKDEYLHAARRAADFILEEMMEDGVLLHSYRDGVSKLPGYLDDYAYLIVALVDVYEASFDVRYIQAAESLAQTMIEKFWDEKHHGFFFTADEHKNLIVRTRPSFDGAVPSGNAMAAYGLLRLAKLVDNADFYDYARKLLEAHYTHMSQIPRGHLNMLVAADFLLYPPKEIAIAGPREAEGTQMLLQTLHSVFVPNKVVAHIDPAAPDAARLEEKMPLLAMKRLVDGKPAAYVCVNYACQAPVTTGPEFLEELEATD